MRSTLATRMPVTDLTAAHLEEFPVWEFAIDEEEREEQDETWVKPVPTSQVPADGLSLSVAVTLKLANGLVYPAIMCCDTYAGFHVQAFAILTTEGRVLFSRNDSRSERQRSLKRLGLRVGQVFPLHYCTRIPYARTGSHEQGTINTHFA